MTITFVGVKLKPNTKLYAFYDDTPVSQYCTPYGGLKGQQLITDADGQIAGTYDVPGSTFFNGEKTFLLTNDKNRTGDPDIETCTASAPFFSGGLDVAKQETTLNVISPTATITSTDVASKAVTVTNTVTLAVPKTLQGFWEFVVYSARKFWLYLEKLSSL